MKLADSWKALIAIVVAAAGAIVTALNALGEGSSLSDLDTRTWVGAAIIVLGSGGVTWWTENSKYAAKIKMWVAAVGAGLASIYVALNDHVITNAEYLTAASAFLVAAGLVYQAKGPAVSE